MTQKELLYIEDAIGHENTIIKVCEDTIEKLSDESLVEFLRNQVNDHQEIKKELINLLEVIANEWSNING